MKNTDQILEMTDFFWRFVFCLMKCLVLFILGTNLIIVCLLLAGLAHFATGNQQAILKDMRDGALKFLVSFIMEISCLLDGDFNKSFKEHSLLEKSHPGIIIESTTVRFTSGKSKLCVWEVLETNSCHSNEDSYSKPNTVSQSRVTQTDTSFLSEQSFKAMQNDSKSASVLKASTSFAFGEKPVKLAQCCQANESHF